MYRDLYVALAQTYCIYW